MKCPACHEEYDDQMEYCPFCGNDNPKVDPKGIDISQPQKTNESTNGQVVDMPITAKDGKDYKLKFDLNDELEKSAYNDINNLINSKDGYFAGYILAILLVAIGAFMIALRSISSAFAVVITVLCFIIGSVIAIVCTSKLNKLSKEIAEKQFDYLKYYLEKKGANIKQFDKNNLDIVYELKGNTFYLGIKYRVYGNRYRRWSN